MMLKTPLRAGLAALAVIAAACFLADAAWAGGAGGAPAVTPAACSLADAAGAEAAAEAAPAATPPVTFNKGDNAWMLTSSVLVLLMTIPGLALFYGGLVRSKNMVSVLMHVFYPVCIVTLIWALYGYSLAFTGGSDFIGGFSK